MHTDLQSVNNYCPYKGSILCVIFVLRVGAHGQAHLKVESLFRNSGYAIIGYAEPMLPKCHKVILSWFLGNIWGKKSVTFMIPI